MRNINAILLQSGMYERIISMFETNLSDELFLTYIKDTILNSFNISNDDLLVMDNLINIDIKYTVKLLILLNFVESKIYSIDHIYRYIYDVVKQYPEYKYLIENNGTPTILTQYKENEIAIVNVTVDDLATMRDIENANIHLILHKYTMYGNSFIPSSNTIKTLQLESLFCNIGDVCKFKDVETLIINESNINDTSLSDKLSHLLQYVEFNLTKLLTLKISITCVIRHYNSAIFGYMKSFIYDDKCKYDHDLSIIDKPNLEILDITNVYNSIKRIYIDDCPKLHTLILNIDKMPDLYAYNIIGWCIDTITTFGCTINNISHIPRNTKYLTIYITNSMQSYISVHKCSKKVKQLKYVIDLTSPIDIIIDEDLEILEICGNTESDITFHIPDNSKLISINICLISAIIVGNIPDRCVIVHNNKKKSYEYMII